MAKFGYEKGKGTHGRVHDETVAHQHVPGRAFEVSNPSVKLIHTIGGGFFNESKYYDSNRSYTAFYQELREKGRISSRILDDAGLTEQAREVIETAQAVALGENGSEPEDLLIIAAWARDPEHGLKLRTTPQILLALAAASPKTKPFVRRYATSIIKRPDEIMQVFAAFRHLFQGDGKGRHRGSLPHGLRKGLAEAISQSSLYALLKYNNTRERPHLADVLRMVSGSKKLPRRRSKEGAVIKDGWPLSKSVYRYIIKGEVGDDAPEMIKARHQFFRLERFEDFTLDLQKAAGLTWENIRSKFGIKTPKTAAEQETNRKVWETCILQMGEMALTRNLRNFEEANISQSAWDAVYEKLGNIKDTRQLPFRFFTAYRETRSTEARSLVAMQLDASCANVPDLPGNTLVLVDNSGSAVGCAVSGKSTLRVSDAGNILSAIIAKRFGRRTTVGVFGDSAIWVPFNQADSCISIKEKIDSVAQKEERSQYGALGIKNASRGSGYYHRSQDFTHGVGVGGGTETGLWFAIDDVTKRKVFFDRIILLSDLCCYTQGDVNCGIDLKPYFGKDGNKATVQSMLDKYRQHVNGKVQVYSINLSGHGQSQLREKDANSHLLSGWSEQIFNVIRDSEMLQVAAKVTATPVEFPTLSVLRERYRKVQLGHNPNIRS
jgi:hypothetical protein